MYKILISRYFSKRSKRLSKKYRGLRRSVIDTLETFDVRKSVSLGNKLYKIRVAVPMMTRGKNKSFRLIVLVLEHKRIITPIVLYFKGDEANLNKKRLVQHVEAVRDELLIYILGH